MKWLKVLLVLTASLSLLLGGMNAAEAKRLGGGGSFGSKFSYNKGVQRQSATPSKPSAAQTQNTDRRQQLGNKGGMMGLLGGLALGGLLGALFFGGAFENINLFDILLFGGVIFLIMKFISSRRPQPATATGYATQARQGFDTNFGSANAVEPVVEAVSSEPTLDGLRGDIPADFNQNAFMDGAKSCFNNLQKAWDSGELGDLRQFTTDHVFAELQDMLRERNANTRTEVVSLNATLLRVNTLGSSMEASVAFDAQMVEDGTPTNVHEIWHFVRLSGSSDPNWQLDGIQQVEG